MDVSVAMGMLFMAIDHCEDAHFADLLHGVHQPATSANLTVSSRCCVVSRIYGIVVGNPCNPIVRSPMFKKCVSPKNATSENGPKCLNFSNRTFSRWTIPHGKCTDKWKIPRSLGGTPLDAFRFKIRGVFLHWRTRRDSNPRPTA